MCEYKRLVMVFAFLGMGILISPVATAAVQEQEGVLGVMQSQFGEVLGVSEEYTLGKDDIIQIEVRNQPEFSGQFVIGPDGKIQYTFIGDIEAEGLTKEEFKEKITKIIERYVKIPQVGITLLAYRSKSVYIFGEVGKPGKYPMRGDSVKLRDVIVESGMPTPDAALRRVYVFKQGQRPIKVDIYKLLYEANLEEDLELASGDVVVVSSTIPSEINRALTKMLAPFTKGATMYGIFGD